MDLKRKNRDEASLCLFSDIMPDMKVQIQRKMHIHFYVFLVLLRVAQFGNLLIGKQKIITRNLQPSLIKIFFGSKIIQCNSN